MVNYPTAMDTFVIICFGSVFAAMLEFAVITFISLYITRYKAKEEKEKEALENLVKIVNEKLKSSDTINGILCNELINKIQNADEPPDETDEPLVILENRNLEAIEIIQVEEERTSKPLNPKGCEAQLKVHFDNLYKKLPERYKLSFENCCNGLSLQMHKLRLKPVPEMYIYSNTDDACEYIDRCSRIYFPSTFMFIMLIYWTTYLYIYEDETMYKNE